MLLSTAGCPWAAGGPRRVSVLAIFCRAYSPESVSTASPRAATPAPRRLGRPARPAGLARLAVGDGRWLPFGSASRRPAGPAPRRIGLPTRPLGAFLDHGSAPSLPTPGARPASRFGGGARGRSAACPRGHLPSCRALRVLRRIGQPQSHPRPRAHQRRRLAPESYPEGRPAPQCRHRLSSPRHRRVRFLVLRALPRLCRAAPGWRPQPAFQREYVASSPRARV